MWQEPLAQPSQSAKVPSIGLFVHQHLLIKHYRHLGTVTALCSQSVTFVRCMALLSPSANVGPFYLPVFLRLHLKTPRRWVKPIPGPHSLGL